MILVIEKVMRILSILSEGQGRGVTVRQISEQSQIPKPTCVHILKSLCKEGCTIRLSRSEGYILGPTLYYLTRHGPFANALVAPSRAVMRNLEKSTGTTVILAVIENNQKYVIAHRDREQGLFSEHPSIKTDDIYRTATGRILLSYMNTEEQRALFSALGAPKPGEWDEVTSIETLEKEAKRIRKSRIVTTGGDIIGFAVPVLKDGICLGSLGLAWMPNEREPVLTDTRREEFVRALLRARTRLERKIQKEEMLGESPV